MTIEQTAAENEEFNAEVAYGQLEAKLKGILSRYHPVSEERINKHWIATRDTLNEFTNQLVEEQVARGKQNTAIASLANEVEALKKMVVMQAVQQGGSPTGVSDGAAD